MKKIGIASVFAITAFAIIFAAILFSACGNRSLIDTTYTFDRAIIFLPNGQTIEGKVQSWKDYDNGDQIQVKIDGKVYLVHAANCILIDE